MSTVEGSTSSPTDSVSRSDRPLVLWSELSEQLLLVGAVVGAVVGLPEGCVCGRVAGGDRVAR